MPLRQIYSIFKSTSFSGAPSSTVSQNPANSSVPTISSSTCRTPNTLISGYARTQQTEPVFSLFNSLRSYDLKPDIFTLSSLIKACNHGQENEISHAIAFKLGFASGAFVTKGLVDNYSKVGDLGSAEKCFEECLVVDAVVNTAMISGYVSNGEFGKARGVFMEMVVLGLDLNEFSLSSVLGSLSDVKEEEQIHGFGIRMGFLSDGSTHLCNVVKSVYCKCGSKRMQSYCLMKCLTHVLFLGLSGLELLMMVTGEVTLLMMVTGEVTFQTMLLMIRKEMGKRLCKL